MYHIEVSLVFLSILRGDEDVVDVRSYENPQVVLKDVIYDTLERRWCITVAKRA